MPAVKDVAELAQYLDQQRIRYHKLGVFDVDGVLRGKYVDRKKFLSAAESGFGFCDVVLGWDSGDVLVDGLSASGWHTGYRDAPVEVDLSTLRLVPFEEATVLLLGRFGGSYADVCPRRALERVVRRAADMGFGARGALEYEFFVFEETPHSVREKGYRGLRPITPGMFGYSALRSSVHDGLYRELLDTMAAMECDIEGLHTETGPGVIEAAIGVDEVLRAADKAALFKTFTKVLAQRRGLMATFMAKWSEDLPGQSGHVHLSLHDAKTGRSAFHDPARPHGMSELMESFVAGQLRYLPEVMPMICPTINSYRRLVPGVWAPTTATWGVENRTTALRVIPGGPKAQRVEYRIGPADANPYLALAAALASGLQGIQEHLELPPPVTGSAYEAKGAVPLPLTLRDATDRFVEARMPRAVFGEPFVEHFSATRYWEDRQHRRHVSDWELARYFEII